MQRKMDLIREILLLIEKSDEGDVTWDQLDKLDPSRALVTYHVKLLTEAGMLDPDASHIDGLLPDAITWAGHEFLDLARSNDTWTKAKSFVVEKVGSASFSVLMKYLTDNASHILAQINPL